MKKIVMVALIALMSMPVFGQLKSATLVASGLTCSMCSKAIYKALEKVPYVEKIDVNIEKSSYSIFFKQGMDIELDEMKKAVEDAGFFVASLKVTASFDKVDVFKDIHIAMSGATFHFVNASKNVLDGARDITVIDKNYLPVKERKKYSKYTQLKCYETGMAAACCPQNVSKTNRIYHVAM